MSSNATQSEMTYISAVREAIRWGLETYPDLFVLGEDVAIPNGPFGATKGLHRKFDRRVFDTPISETAMIGAALGAALRGMRPIVEIMYQDFTLVAMDQIVNQVANARYVSNGQMSAPLVIRTQGGHSPGACAQHSHAIEAFWAHTPGLRVGLPSTPQDAFDMLRGSIATDDPVMLVESRMLYPTKGLVDLTGPVPPVGGTRVVRSGADVTIVGWSRSAVDAEAAALQLMEDGIDATVIDLRWLSPLDTSAVVSSVQATGRLLVVHEANRTAGFGAEIVARIQESCFDALRAPIGRVASLDVPTPAAPALQHAVIPGVAQIVQAARRLVA